MKNNFTIYKRRHFSGPGTGYYIIPASSGHPGSDVISPATADYIIRTGQDDNSANEIIEGYLYRNI